MRLWIICKLFSGHIITILVDQRGLERAVHKHHFIPKSRTEYEGGTVLLCGTYHTIFHRRQTEEETKKRHKLSEDEIRALFT